MNGGVLYTAEDGTEWRVTLEAPGKVLSVPASLEKSGALLPEHELRIVFARGDDEEYSAEYSQAYASSSRSRIRDASGSTPPGESSPARS